MSDPTLWLVLPQIGPMSDVNQMAKLGRTWPKLEVGDPETTPRCPHG